MLFFFLDLILMTVRSRPEICFANLCVGKQARSRFERFIEVFWSIFKYASVSIEELILIRATLIANTLIILTTAALILFVIKGRHRKSEKAFPVKKPNLHQTPQLKQKFVLIIQCESNPTHRHSYEITITQSESIRNQISHIQILINTKQHGKNFVLSIGVKIEFESCNNVNHLCRAKLSFETKQVPQQQPFVENNFQKEEVATVESQLTNEIKKCLVSSIKVLKSRQNQNPHLE